MTLNTVVEAANNFGDTREGAGAGPMALAVVALLAIATVLLWRNMTARIKRLPAAFPTEGSVGEPAEAEAAPPAAAPPADGAPADAGQAPAERSRTES